MNDVELLKRIYFLSARLRLRNPSTKMEQRVWREIREELAGGFDE